MSERLFGEFRLPIIEKSFEKIGKKKVARILVSITGDTRPDGTPDEDLEGQVTDFDASHECAKAWAGNVVYHHLEGDGAEVGQAVDCIVLSKKREIFGDFKIDNPIVVRMIEANVPFECSWRGEYFKRPEAVKSRDGSTRLIERIFPVRWKEVSIMPAFNGAARPSSVTLAVATKSADGGGKKEAMNMAEDPNMAAPPEKTGEPAAPSAPPANKGLAKSQKAIQGAIDALTEEMGSHPVLGAVYQPIVDTLASALESLSGKKPDAEPIEVASAISDDMGVKGRGAPLAQRVDFAPVLEAVKGLADSFDPKYDAIKAQLAAQGELISKIASTPQSAAVGITRAPQGGGEAAKGKTNADLIVTAAKDLAKRDPGNSRSILDAAFLLAHAAETGR
jgi:hypothetical protein